MPNGPAQACKTSEVGPFLGGGGDTHIEIKKIFKKNMRSANLKLNRLIKKLHLFPNTIVNNRVLVIIW